MKIMNTYQLFKKIGDGGDFSAMNHCQWFLVFLGGTLLSLLFVIISEIVRYKFLNYLKESPKPYVLLDVHRLQVVDEDVIPLLSDRNDAPRKPKTDPAAENEALSSLHAALAMKEEGKMDKALKLFQHATTLAPKHPDVLNHYGEFLEMTQKDVMKADQLYFQALTYCPTHSAALSNRKRTAAVVEEMDKSFFKRIDSKRDILSAIPESNRALIRAKKEAYFQHIYHTVGIEGNTMSLSQTRSIVETQMVVAGKSVMEHNEILGLDAAMKYINHTLVNRFGPILINDILEIHRRVMGYVDPFGCGELRRTQVYVGGHIPPPPEDIPWRMRQLELWLNSEEAARMHALEYAALAHYKLVHIHPFDDGNGRTSRLLMNAILMQAGFPPVIIFKQDRHKYYEVLDIGNQGDIRPFIRFIAECTEKTLDLFLWATQEYSSQVPALDDDSKTIVVDSSLLTAH